MNYTTYVSGTIDLTNLPKTNKEIIRNFLEEAYDASEVSEMLEEDEIIIELEWDTFDASEKFLVLMTKIAQQLSKNTEALLLCNGEKDDDIWGIIIKNQRVFTQRYELVPDGDPEEYEKVRNK